MALNRSDKSRILRRYFPGMTRNSEMSTEPSVFPLAVSVPSPSAGAMRNRQRHQVVDVQFAGTADGLSCVRPHPAPGDHPALFIGLKGHADTGLGNQGLLPCVLAVAVLVVPVAPLSTVVFRQAGRHRSNGNSKHDSGGRGSAGNNRGGWRSRDLGCRSGRRDGGQRGGGRHRDRRRCRGEFVSKVAARCRRKQEKDRE